MFGRRAAAPNLDFDVGEQKQLADVSFDGSRNPVSYPAGQPMVEVLARQLSGTVTAWKVSVTRSEVEKQTLPCMFRFGRWCSRSR